MPNLNVGLVLAMVICTNANANGCTGQYTASYCATYDGISCTKYAYYTTCASCDYGYTSSQEQIGTDAANGTPVYVTSCIYTGIPDEPSTSDTMIISMSSVGATSYRNYGFYVATVGYDVDPDTGLLSDGLPLLPKDDNDNFIFRPVCTGTNFYPTNGIAPKCDFNMEKYLQYFEEYETYPYPGDFDEVVSNCTGCSRCTSSCGYYRVDDSPYLRHGCYEYQDVPGNYCPFVPSGDYRCANGYYGVASYNNGSYSGCAACPTLAQSSLTVVSNPSGITTVSSFNGNNTDITGCYAESGDNDTRVVLNDGMGNFYWDNDGYGTCYYSSN